MTNNYYQKSKEKLQKDVRERYTQKKPKKKPKKKKNEKEVIIRIFLKNKRRN